MDAEGCEGAARRCEGVAAVLVGNESGTEGGIEGSIEGDIEGVVVESGIEDGVRGAVHEGVLVGVGPDGVERAGVAGSRELTGEAPRSQRLHGWHSSSERICGVVTA